MAIKVATGDGGGALALASYAGGAGLRRNQVQDDQMKALERQKAMELQQDFTLQRDNNQFDQALTQDLFRSDLKRDDITWEMDQTQRAEFNNLSKSYAAAVASGDFTEDELKVIRKETQQKQMGLQPMPRVNEKSPYPEGQGKGQAWAQDGAAMLTRDDKGNVKKLYDIKPPESPGQVDVADISKIYSQVSTELGTLAESGVADPKAVADEVKNRINLIKEIMNPTPPPVSGGAIPNVPGPGSLPPNQFDSYMQPGMESIRGAPVQATLPAPTANAPSSATPEEKPKTSIADLQKFVKQHSPAANANPYSPESVKAYIAKGKFNNKQSSLLSGAAARLDKYQAKIDAADPGSQERVDLVLKRLADYEYLKSQMGAVQ